MIANGEIQERVIAILDQNEFKAKTKHWAWEKHASGGHSILVELHAPSPKAGIVSLHIEGGRVKRRSSSIEEAPTEEKKIHGKHNRELIGYELHPFHFELDGLRLSIPNPAWVGSVDGACEHLFATGDYFEGTEAWSRMDDELEENDQTVMEDFLERSTREQDAVIVKLGAEAAKTLAALRDSPLWWSDFIENEVVTADIDEPSFSTTYYSVFVATPEEAIEALKLRYFEAARALEGLG